MSDLYQNYIIEKSSTKNRVYYFLSPKVCCFLNTYEQLREFINLGCEQEIIEKKDTRANWLVFRDGVERDFSSEQIEELKNIIDLRNLKILSE